MTALDLIKRAFRLLGVYSIGEEPSAEESQDALVTFNALMDSISNGGMVYEKTLDSIALTAATASYTVGPSGATVTTRPVRVLGESYILFNGVSYPLDLLSLQEYNDIGVKTSQGIPIGVWVQAAMPNITLTFWPVPDQAMTLKLWSDKQIVGTLALTTTLSLPPGYADLAYLLAVELAPEYEVAVPDPVAKGAARCRRILKRTNLQVPKLTLDVPGLYQSGDYRSGV